MTDEMDETDGDTFKCVECGEVKCSSELEPGFSETCTECINDPFNDLPAEQPREGGAS